VTDDIGETLKLGKNGRVTVPKDIRDYYELEYGDRVSVTFHLENNETEND
jgi:AbrB family looped-hinge helix DNA binding protein